MCTKALIMEAMNSVSKQETEYSHSLLGIFDALCCKCNLIKIESLIIQHISLPFVPKKRNMYSLHKCIFKKHVIQRKHYKAINGGTHIFFCFKTRIARAFTASWAGPGRVFFICSLYFISSRSSFLIFSSTDSPRFPICTMSSGIHSKHKTRAHNSSLFFCYFTVGPILPAIFTNSPNSKFLYQWFERFLL